MDDVRPHVALFVPSLRGGGAERVMMDLARAFADGGHAIDVVVLNRDGAVVDDLGPGVRLVDLDRSRAALALPALLRYLRRYRPRALLSTLEHANVVAVAAARLAGGVRVVVREANTPTRDLAAMGLKGHVLRAAMRWAYRRADAVVAVSHGVADGLVTALGLRQEHLHVIYNPVLTPRVLEGASAAPDHPWYKDGGPPVVLGVGRLSEQKGFDVLLRAFAMARTSEPCRLIVLGEGPLRTDLLDLAVELDVSGEVDLPGYATNPFAHMARCGVFVLSSRWEGLPNVLIQALACGAQVVATDCPSGPAEVLEGGRYGRLVPVDDVAALAAGILGALRAPTPPPPETWARRYAVAEVARAYLDELLPAEAGRST